MRQPSATDEKSECIFDIKMKFDPKNALSPSCEPSEGLVKFLNAILRGNYNAR